MPSMHWARVMTCAPACIRSATVRPSRAPSTMKSEMMAMASGWLSLTPRSSRRRATMAAIEMSNLAFSRGDRFMRALALVDLVEPEPWQRVGRSTAQHRHHVGAQARGILGTEARHCKSIPGRDCGLATEGRCDLPDTLDQRLVAGNDQRRADRDTAIRNRPLPQLLADAVFQPNGLRKHKLSAAPHAPPIDESALLHPLAHGRAAEHGDFAEQERGVFGEIDVDMPRHLRAVEQDGFLRQP